MTREEELNLIKKERDEMEKYMTDMFDLAFMLNNRNDVMNPQLHYEKLSRMVTHYMGSIQQSYGYMSIKVIEALEQEPSREIEDYENEIEDLHNRLDIAEYDKERLREEVTNLETKIKALEQEPILEQEPVVEPLERLAESTAKTAKVLERLSEQERILDKIRSDLYKLYNDRPSDYNHSQRTELFCEVIKILDKYRKEN